MSRRTGEGRGVLRPSGQRRGGGAVLEGSGEEKQVPPQEGADSPAAAAQETAGDRAYSTRALLARSSA